MGVMQGIQVTVQVKSHRRGGDEMPGGVGWGWGCPSGNTIHFNHLLPPILDTWLKVYAREDGWWSRYDLAFDKGSLLPQWKVLLD